MPTWLKLPEKTYYLIESFYILPLIFLMWILAAGVLHVLSGTFFGGKGRFENLFVMTGYSLLADRITVGRAVRRAYGAVLVLVLIVACTLAISSWS